MCVKTFEFALFDIQLVKPFYLNVPKIFMSFHCTIQTIWENKRCQVINSMRQFEKGRCGNFFHNITNSYTITTESVKYDNVVIESSVLAFHPLGLT